MGEDFDREHCVDLDKLFWSEFSRETQEELRESLRRNLFSEKRCHIYKGEQYHFCLLQHLLNQEGLCDV